ncbi:MAG: phage distal tail protein, Rcc01695 family [Planktomarina sp.]
MSFHEVQFPTNLSFGSSGGPERRTEIVTLANGFEERNTPWHHSRRRYDAGLAVRTAADIEKVLAFFEARQGQLYGFRWKDWADYRSKAENRDVQDDDQVIGTGDGVQTQFQLSKTYESGGASYTRPITKPVHGSVVVAVGGVAQKDTIDFTVDTATGIVTFTHAVDEHAEVTAGFEFDVPVRFDTDQIITSLAHFNAGEVPNVPIVEVRV